MTKPILWTKHARQNLDDREIDQDEVEHAVREPEASVSELPGTQVLMRRYHDKILDKEMLLRVVVAESESAITVITLYKTSQINRYLKGT